MKKRCFLSRLWHSFYPGTGAGCTLVSGCEAAKTDGGHPARRQGMVYVRLNCTQSDMSRLLSVRDEDGVSWHSQQMDNAQEEILIETSGWRCGLYYLFVVHGSGSVCQAGFFIRGTETVVVSRRRHKEAEPR